MKKIPIKENDIIVPFKVLGLHIFISASIEYFYKGDSNVLQYFGNVRHNLKAPNAFVKVVIKTNYTEL